MECFAICFDEFERLQPGTKITLGAKDKKILKDFQKIAKEITKEMDEFKFYVASEKIYHYFWHTFCDKIIEEQKPRSIRLASKVKKKKHPANIFYLHCFLNHLKILHPFMPFITEEIYQQLPIKNKQKCIMVEEWPEK